MSPALKSLAAAAGASAMVLGSIVGRGALDDKNSQDGLRFSVACDPVAETFCRAAADADSRLTIRVERPEVTTKRLLDLPEGTRPDIQAWVTAGPWLQMADGRRGGRPPTGRAFNFVASTPVVLVTRLAQKLDSCGKPPAGCLPLPTNPLGLPSPRTSGIGLAGLAQLVLANTGRKAADLDRGAIESGDAAATVDAVSRRTNTTAGLEQLNANFAQANPLVSTQAATAGATGRANVVTSEPAVRVVLQVGLLDPSAQQPFSADEPAGRALARAATTAGWAAAGESSGGLPDPGVLAALQDAWTGP